MHLQARTVRCRFPEPPRGEGHDPDRWIVVGVIVIAALIVGAFLWSRRARSAHLRDTSARNMTGPLRQGRSFKAEADLAERESRVKKLDIRALRPAERSEFTGRWTDVQARFVDDPRER